MLFVFSRIKYQILGSKWTGNGQPLQYYFGLIYFEDAYGNESKNFIASALNCKLMKMYFLLLSYILKIINDINIEMQSEEPIMHIYIPRMSFLLKLLVIILKELLYVQSLLTPLILN